VSLADREPCADCPLVLAAARLLTESQRARRVVDYGAVALSRRELEVLTMAAEGDVDKEIGRKLGIALNTVRNHHRSIRAKLHVDNRTSAAVKAILLGLVEIEIGQVETTAEEEGNGSGLRSVSES
jgi:DNA-binding CsgD family transcriptional regulator